MKLFKYFNKNGLFQIFVFVFLPVIIQSCQGELGKNKVKIYEEQITIPTYPIGEPEINPVFYTPENYQGAQKKVYPYPLLNKLTDTITDKTYKGLFLENDYISLCVLPEIGGRLYYAKDKSNDYDFVYLNRVIKPALIGMAGAWISGGVEWNIPHHHRVSTFMPLDYKLVENKNGSKTIWVGEYEKRHGTRWIVGLTLYPDKAYIETTIRYFNVTPYVQSFLIWANMAVHANENYQVIFPPDVERAVYHSKVEFVDWPVADQYYRGIDFTGGVDISWWKNTSSPTSFFAWGTEQDFIAGYDRGQEAGTILIGDRFNLPGKKFWNWGDNDVGRMWDKKLTDEDGPYLELMMGAFSDNQPDYSWINPETTKECTMYYYPVKGLDNIKNANRDFAINYELEENKVIVQLFATAKNTDLKLIVYSGSTFFSDKIISINSNNVFTIEVEIPSDMNREDLKLVLFSKDGEELISCQPESPKNKPLPELYKEPAEPEQIKDLNELFLSGLRLEQFYNPRLNPMAYYEEVLRRDPDNFLANLQAGIWYLKTGDNVKAEQLLKMAAGQVTGNHTSPKYGEALYNLGLCLFNQEKYEEAYEVLFRASWDYQWASSSFLLLANIDCLEKDMEGALVNIDRAIKSDNNNIEASLIKAILLRKLDKYEEAQEILVKIQKNDPLNFIAQNEMYLLSSFVKTGSRPKQSLSDLRIFMRNEPDNYLETVSRYGKAGFYDEAIELLELATASENIKLNSYPMIYYYLGYYYDLNKDEEKAIANYRKGSKLPVDYCFPYGTTSEKALNSSLLKYPEDANAHYYLGNICCDNRPDKAKIEWQRSGGIDPNKAIVYRNMAFLYANIYDSINKAIENIEKAIELNPHDPLYFTEAGNYYEYAKVKPEKRYAHFRENFATIQKSDASLIKEINLSIIMGEYDHAINSLREGHFNAAEASDINLHEQWADAHILRGRFFVKEGDYEKALEDFNTAMEFPENLETVGNQRVQIANYFIGLTYKLIGDDVKAKEYFNILISGEENSDRGGSSIADLAYYEALVYWELGNNGKAREILNNLIKRGNSRLVYKAHSAMYTGSVKIKQSRVRSRANAYYSIGLGYLGLGDKQTAISFFNKTLYEHPGHLGVRVILNEL